MTEWETFFDVLSRSIDDAETSGLLEVRSELTGYSGAKLIGLLQRLVRTCTDEQTAYVEVGVFQGLTLLSVASAAPLTNVFGIDNFSQFDADGINRDLVETRRRSLQADNAEVIDLDFEMALLSLPEHIGTRSVGVYFVDGPHDYRSQLICLELMRPHLAERAVIVVDDSNYEHVRQANADFLRAHPEFGLAFETYTGRHPSNMDGESLADARAGWWNGVNVLVTDPLGILDRLYPPTDLDRTRYVNEHIVHSERNGDLAPEAVAVADALLGWNPIRLVSRAVKLHRAARDEGRKRPGSFDHCNVGDATPATRRANRSNASG